MKKFILLPGFKSLFAFLLILIPFIGKTQCTHTLTLNDSWGDGWNSAAINLSVNGVDEGDWTINSGSTGSVTFQASTGDVIVVSWLAGGSYPSECSWFITDGNTGAVIGSEFFYTDGTQSLTGACAFVCSAPSALASSAVIGSSATISWTAISPAPGVGYDYYYSTTNTAPTTTETGSTPNNTTLTQSLTGLTPSTTYYYWVRSDCDGTDKSDWASGGSFTTSCAAVVAPFLESFDATSIPSCWSQSATTGGPWVFGTANSASTFTWNTNGCAAVPSGSSAQFDLTGTDAGVILQMVDVDITAIAPAPILTFQHFMCGTGSNYSSLNKTYVEAYNGTSWVEVALIQSGSAAWTTYSYDLLSFTFSSNIVRIRFRGESGGSSGDGKGDIAIDDIEIKEKPCEAPNALTSSALTSTSATISWSQASLLPSSGYEYYLSTSSATPSASPGTEVDVAAGVYTVNLTGLSAATQYYFWVRSDCGGGEVSAWTGSGTFTTVSCTGPTTPASNFQKVAITQTTAEISWDDGNGASTIVVASTSPLSGNPLEDTPYSANINFGSGAALAGGYVVYSGSINSITIQNLTANTTYYLGIYEMTTSPAGCYNVTDLALKATVHTSPSDLITLGTGTLLGVASYAGVFNNYYENNRCQILYKASELGGTADNITDLSFDISQVAPSGYRTFTDFTVKLMHTDETGWTSGAFFEASSVLTGGVAATTVFSSASYAMPTATGWFTIDITDFAYNGTDDLLVEIVWGDNGWLVYTNNGEQYYHNHTDMSAGGEYIVAYGYADSESPALIDGYTNVRPNMKFGLACGVAVGTVSASSSVVSSCSEVPTVSLSGQEAGSTLQWQYSTDNTTYYDIYGATSSSEVTPYISQGTVYIRAAVTNVCTDYTAAESITSSAAAGCDFWEGFTSTDPGVVSNWSQGAVPASQSTNVLVLKTLTNSPIYESSILAADLWIQDGATLNAGSVNHYITGDFTNNGTFNASTGTIYMKSTVDQAINGTAGTTFYNLGISNTGSGVTLGAATTVANQLTLTSGDIDASSNSLTLGSEAFVTGGSDASHVIGTMVKTTASTSKFTFPLGDGTQYKAISITPQNGTSTEWTSKYFNTPYSSTTLGSSAGDIDHVSTYEYWDLDRTGSDPAKVEIPWVALNEVEVYADLRLAHWDSGASAWEIIASDAVGSNYFGNLTSQGYQNSFSPFTLGSSSSTNVLPIELVSFSGEKKDNRNILNWTTASEINNAFFTVEKSYNGIDFEWVGTKEGTSPSTQIINYSLTDYYILETLNYYRLKQTDFDGKFEYSNTISIDNRVDASFKEIIGKTNLLGQDVDECYNGIVIVRYKDGTSQKFYQFK